MAIEAVRDQQSRKPLVGGMVFRFQLAFGASAAGEPADCPGTR
jgi:hypothetical protein